MVVRDGTYHHGDILNYLKGEELHCVGQGVRLISVCEDA